MTMIRQRIKLWSLQKYAALAEKEAARSSRWESGEGVGVWGQFDEWWTKQLDKVRYTPDDCQEGCIKTTLERKFITEESELFSNSNSNVQACHGISKLNLDLYGLIIGFAANSGELYTWQQVSVSCYNVATRLLYAGGIHLKSERAYMSFVMGLRAPSQDRQGLISHLLKKSRVTHLIGRIEVYGFLCYDYREVRTRLQFHHTGIRPCIVIHAFHFPAMRSVIDSSLPLPSEAKYWLKQTLKRDSCLSGTARWKQLSRGTSNYFQPVLADFSIVCYPDRWDSGRLGQLETYEFGQIARETQPTTLIISQPPDGYDTNRNLMKTWVRHG